MPITKNIALVDKGIIFCYVYKELIPEKTYLKKYISPIASIEIFLSYKQLEGLLKDDFKRSIGM